MSTYEDVLREMIKAKYGSILGMAKATGIPKTTIYHALDRGLDNTTTRVRRQIESALGIEPEAAAKEQFEANQYTLNDDETEIINVYRKISPEGKQAVMTLLRLLEKRFGLEE